MSKQIARRGIAGLTIVGLHVRRACPRNLPPAYASLVPLTAPTTPPHTPAQYRTPHSKYAAIR
eukprot:1115771-Rhodomonas_salina.2